LLRGAALGAFRAESVIGPVAIAAFRASSSDNGAKLNGFNSFDFRTLGDDPLFD
jgi:hypothetical protein